MADGLVKTDYDELIENLPEEVSSKLVSAEKLAISWIETRTEKELELFRKLVKITENDGFFERNCKTSMMIGTILMWVSLGQVSTGLNFSFAQNIIAC